VAEQLPEVEILLKRLSSLEAQIVHLQAEVADLRAENARLEHRVEASVGTEQPEQPQATQQRRVSEEANLAQRQEATRRTAWAHGSNLTGGGETRPGAGAFARALRCVWAGHLGA
jgi:multidrug resistance efflux pump